MCSASLLALHLFILILAYSSLVFFLFILSFLILVISIPTLYFIFFLAHLNIASPIISAFLPLHSVILLALVGRYVYVKLFHQHARRQLRSPHMARAGE